MKKLILSLWATLMLLGCNYDDSQIKDDVQDLQNRVSALETLCTQMNTNIISIQTLVNSLNNNDYITSVVPIKSGDDIIGYTITFQKNAPITIYNGVNGNTPSIGVKQDTDGIWYWTLNGNWLLDENGSKVCASGMQGNKGDDGNPGVIPQLKIVDGYWYVSIDNGRNWTMLGKATGEDGKDGDSMFSSVTYDDKYAYFTLVDGTVLTVPLNTNIPKLQFTLDKETDIHLTGGGSITLNYSITAPYGAKTTFTSYESGNWNVKINNISSTKGTITITAPNPVETGKILLVLSDDFGNVFMKTLEIIGDDNVIKIVKTEYTIDEFGGYVDVAVNANLGFVVQIPDEGQSWISVVSTGATTRLSISANSDYDSRTSSVRFKGNDGETYQDITITQLQNNAIVVSSNQVTISDEAQTHTLIVRANIDCKISIPTGIDWITHTTTRALTEKVFLLNIQENEEYTSRSAVVVVSDINEKIQQSITITQAGYTPVYVSIPDGAFLKCLAEKYDINGDGKIDQKEARKITSINCSNSSVSSLSGIEYFSNLKTLECSKTYITSLDISTNTNLSEITCQNNELLTSLKLPPITAISARAFVGCTALTEVDLPNTLTSVGNDAFAGCSSLRTLYIRSDIKNTYLGAFYGAAIHNLHITDKASVITESMFSKISTLETVSIGENVEVIGREAFEDCINLKTVSFEKYSKFTTFANKVFNNCGNLEVLDMRYCQEFTSLSTGGGAAIFGSHTNSPVLNIYLGARVPPVLIYTYANPYIYHNASNYFSYNLFVPADCIDAYKASKLWYDSRYVTIDAL